MADQKLENLLSTFQMSTDPAKEMSEDALRYLKNRIRPMSSILIMNEDINAFDKMDHLGWLGAAEINILISKAQELDKPGMLIWFLHLKNRKNYFKEQEFIL